ncbi:hypothetical protein D9M71_783040 [compost metagenome]
MEPIIPKCTIGCRANNQWPSRQLTSTRSAPWVIAAACTISASWGLGPSLTGSTKPRANHNANHVTANTWNTRRPRGRLPNQRLNSHGISGAATSTSAGNAG